MSYNGMVSTDRLIFGQLAARVARYWRRSIDAALTKSELSQATALPLLVLSRKGKGARQGIIAEEMGLDATALVRVVDLLRAGGLVESREDHSDRRAKILTLTREGQARAKTIEGVIRVMRDDVLESISDDDLATTVRVLTQIEDNLLKRLAA